MKKHNLKPINRSKIRLIAGKTYYTFSRYLLWFSGKIKFAENQSKQNLEHVIFSHNTPLLRKLRDVDMQYQYNKIINLKLAVAKVDGIIIKSGGTL